MNPWAGRPPRPKIGKEAKQIKKKNKKKEKQKEKRKETTSKVSSESVLRFLYSLEDFHYILTTLKCVNS